MTLATLALAACASDPHPAALQPRAAGGYKVGKPYQVKGVWYTPAEQPHYNEVGVGSWYGEQFHNRYTASGEVFDMDIPSAAHKTLPLPSLVEVTNLDNGRKTVLRVNDRGPFVDGRIIDLSRAAAQKLGYGQQGLARVRVRYIGPAPALATDARLYRASAPPPKTSPAARPVLTASTTSRALPAGWLTQPQYLPERIPPNLQRPLSPLPSSTEDGAGPVRVQAGAFASRANAERAAAQLSRAGEAQILETMRDGGVLYRVVVSGPDGAQGVSLRAQVADLGYPDARIVGAD